MTASPRRRGLPEPGRVPEHAARGGPRRQGGDNLRGCTTREFKERRERVLAAIHPGVLVIPSAPLAIRNNDVEHEYRQDSDFFYLTGFDEPESVLVLNSQSEQPLHVVRACARPRA